MAYENLQTGILPDGSLSERLKGDLFWRKANLLSHSMKENGVYSKKLNKEALVADILERYDSRKNEIPDFELSGNEFMPFPPTAAGRDRMIESVVKVMLTRDHYENQLRDRGRRSAGDIMLLEALVNVVNLFFRKNGFDEKSRKNIQGPDKNAAKTNFPDAARKYRLVVNDIIKGELPDDMPLEKSSHDDLWIDEVVSAKEVPALSVAIPDNYLSQIMDTTLIVTATYDISGPERFLIGVSITGIHDGWVEMVWLATPDDLRNHSDYVTHVVNRGRSMSGIKGTFMEIHVSGEHELMLPLLTAAGMDISVADNNIYEFTLDEVKRDKSLFAAAEKLKCIPVNNMESDKADAISERILLGQSAVSARLPIQWDMYRKDLCLLHIGKETSGMLLFSGVGNVIVFDLAYSNGGIVLAALLGTALKNADKLLGRDQNILVPIVKEETRSLIKRLVPGAARGKIAEACIWY